MGKIYIDFLHLYISLGGYLKKKNIAKKHKKTDLTKRLEKVLQKTERRLKKKNQFLMDAVKRKKELQKTRPDKDLKFMADSLQNENTSLKKHVEHLKLKVKSLEIENETHKQKKHELEQDVNQKATIIELLEKGEVEISGICHAVIENVKTKWLGWPDGAIIEEVDVTVLNNSLDELKGVHLDLYVAKDNKIIHKMEGIKTKKDIKPKGKISCKIHLFKSLKKKGVYVLTLKTYSESLGKELNCLEKTIVI